MRIIGGTDRGRKLLTPGGDAVRPTSDRAREALFNMLGQNCADMRVLDLFAGTGALGLEALSRGAHSAVFVEQHAATIRILERNLAALTVAGKARSRIVQSDVATALGTQIHGPFELVFADPPYGRAVDLYGSVLRRLKPLLAPAARISLESSKREMAEVAGLVDRAGFTVDRQRTYGLAAITLIVHDTREGDAPIAQDDSTEDDA